MSWRLAKGRPADDTIQAVRVSSWTTGSSLSGRGSLLRGRERSILTLGPFGGARIRSEPDSHGMRPTKRAISERVARVRQQVDKQFRRVHPSEAERTTPVGARLTRLARISPALRSCQASTPPRLPACACPRRRFSLRREQVRAPGLRARRLAGTVPFRSVSPPRPTLAPELNSPRALLPTRPPRPYWARHCADLRHGEGAPHRTSWPMFPTALVTGSGAQT
jgi:hypothetical protein